MAEDFWMNPAGEIVVNASDELKDCAHCPCSAVCVGSKNFGYVARCYFSWNFGSITEGPIIFSLLWDQAGFGSDNSARNTWSGTATCGGPGHGFNLRVYCSDDQWYFDLFLADFGPNYATPVANVPGGAALLNASPVHVYGEITTGFAADDFPFCGKSGFYPSGDRLDDFHFDMTES